MAGGFGAVPDVEQDVEQADREAHVDLGVHGRSNANAGGRGESRKWYRLPRSDIRTPEGTLSTRRLQHHRLQEGTAAVIGEMCAQVVRDCIIMHSIL